MLSTFTLIITIFSIGLLFSYYKTRRFISPYGLTTLILFILLVLLRILTLPKYPTLFYVPMTVLTSGLIIAIFTAIALVVLGVYFSLTRKSEAKPKSKSIQYILKLFVLYFFFALIEQVFFQFVVSETIADLVSNFWTTVLISSIFFTLFHFQKYSPIERILFASGAFLMQVVYVSIYLTYGNIIWLAVSMAIIATTYYSFIYQGDILKSRIG